MNQIVKTDDPTSLPATSDAAALMLTITRAATDATVDAEKMERLWALYEKMDARRAEREFNDAMRTCQEEIPAIFKNKKADKNRYADLEQVLDVVAPIYTKNGFSLSFGNEDSPLDKHYRVTCFVSHVGGHTRKCHADLPIDGSGSKNATQGFGSTISYGRRYLTLMIFNISTTDDNDAGDTGGGNGKLSAKQAEELAALIQRVGMPMDKFLAWAKFPAIADIPAENFQKAVNAVNAWAANKKGGQQ